MLDGFLTTSARTPPNLPANDNGIDMITSPPLIEARRGARPTPAAEHERCPFLVEVGNAQPPARPHPPLGLASWRIESDARAAEVLAAFARTGGLATTDEVALLLRRRTSRPIAMLGRWILEQRVVSFAWRGELVLPLFQFERADMGVRAAVTAVLDELEGTFDDWELATWFALPNAWLGEQAPIDALDHDPDAVRQAARADRFVARG